MLQYAAVSRDSGDSNYMDVKRDTHMDASAASLPIVAESVSALTESQRAQQAPSQTSIAAASDTLQLLKWGSRLLIFQQVFLRYSTEYILYQYFPVLLFTFCTSFGSLDRVQCSTFFIREVSTVSIADDSAKSRE